MAMLSLLAPRHGYADTFSSLLGDLHNPQVSLPGLEGVLSGNAAYDLAGYNSSDDYQNFSYTAFASPDEWGSPPDGDQCKILPSVVGHFFCEYQQNFVPLKSTY